MSIGKIPENDPSITPIEPSKVGSAQTGNVRKPSENPDMKAVDHRKLPKESKFAFMLAGFGLLKP